MNRFELHSPSITENDVAFSWTNDDHGLYRRKSFRMELRGANRIPERLWLLLAMLCLHTHWILLRPLRIQLPHRLLPGEKDLWLRMMQIGFQTLEGHRNEPESSLDIELVEGARILPSPTAMPPSTRCATSFSGGRDSLVQTGLLLELSDHPLLVATTSPMPPLFDQSTKRRRQVFQKMASRPDLKFREVISDFRSSWNNAYSKKNGYPVSVNAMTDTLLYTAATIAASWIEGCPQVYLASENEVSDNATKDGRVVLFHHFMYSIPIQHGISLLLKPWGMQYGSLTCPLRGPLVQSLLRRRYPELAKWQYSCWMVSDSESACSHCDKCLLVGLGTIVNGGDPADIGIDLLKLIRFAAAFKPGYRNRTEAGPLARDRVTYEHKMNIIRYIRQVRPADIIRLRPDVLKSITGLRRLFAYARAHRRASRMHVDAASGWRPAYAEFIPGPIRNQVATIYRDMFPSAEPSSYADDLAGNRILVEYLNQSGIHTETT